MWSSLQWPQTFFIPTPTLTAGQMDTKREIFGSKNRHNVQFLSYAGQLDEGLNVQQDHYSHGKFWRGWDCFYLFYLFFFFKKGHAGRIGIDVIKGAKR